MKIRLDRWLATLREGSRSEVREWVRGGLVAVDGRVIRDPALSFDPDTACLALRGRPLDGRLQRHVMLYKPAGLLTAARDPKQPVVQGLLPPAYEGVGCMPVGRLDRDTTGLLLFTTDGELNHRLLSPTRHVPKRYRAWVEGCLTDQDVAAFAAGLPLGDFTALPADLRILQAADDCSLAEVVVHEGKFHQVKRMFSAVGHEVLSLHRASFGPLELDSSLREGDWRELTPEELQALRRAACMDESAPK